MQEQTQTRQAALTGGGGLDSVFGDDSVFAPRVEVNHGVHTGVAQADQTVGEIRRRMHDRLALHGETQAFVDGREVDDNTRVRAGQKLTFMRDAGEKGAS